MSIVIPSYQGREVLLEALASIRASALAPTAVIVVDNASSDGSLEAIAEGFPEVTVLSNTRNEGFGAACNRGLRLALECGHELVLLLNQDARLERDTIGSMVELARGQHRIAVVGCRTLSSRSHVGGSAILLYNGAWRWWLPTVQRIPGIGCSSAGSAGPPRQVDFVWGHAMLLRVEALQCVGLFDESFFMYYEDLDLCRRLQLAGWELWCDSRVFLWHAMPDGARAKGSQICRWRMKMTSLRLFYHKHTPAPAADSLWLLASLFEAYWLVRGAHWRALAHLAQAIWDQLKRS